MSLDVFWTGLEYAVRDCETKAFLSLHQTRLEAAKALRESETGSLDVALQPRTEEFSMEAETRTCKREGCDEPAKATRGRYAGLCAEHTTEASTVRAAAPVDIETVASTNGSVLSLAHQVSELLAAALAVEEASDAFQAACSTYTDALAKVVEAQIK